MTNGPRLTREKLDQAVGLVQRAGVDVWLTFVRETAGGGDPVLPFLMEGGLTWQSALMVAATGERVAVVGNYDADPLLASGDWTKVVPYVQSIREPLLAELDRLAGPAGRVAVNYSTNDDKADGLSHGMWLVLQGIVKGTRFEGRIESAEAIVKPLRGRKTPTELARIVGAIEAGDRMFGEIERFARVGVSERAIYDHVHALASEWGVTFSWDPAGDPIVNTGPDSMIGHGVPSSTITVQPGHVLHVDLGLTMDGYSSDVQRCWFVGDSVPEDVRLGLEAVNGAISAAAAVLRPGVQGWEVDAAARASVVAAGYPEYLHAVGHQVGRVAHDGGAILGPRWERYGNTPVTPVEEGEVYTLELGVTPAGRGYIGIEEMVVVTADGCRFLTERQTSMPSLQV